MKGAEKWPKTISWLKTIHGGFWSLIKENYQLSGDLNLWTKHLTTLYNWKEVLCLLPASPAQGLWCCQELPPLLLNCFNINGLKLCNYFVKYAFIEGQQEIHCFNCFTAATSRPNIPNLKVSASITKSYRHFKITL